MTQMGLVLPLESESIRSRQGPWTQLWRKLFTRRKFVPPIMMQFPSIGTDWRRSLPKRSSCAVIEPSYITGQAIAVDDGFEATGIGCQHCVPTFTGNTGRPKASRVSRGPAYTKNPSEDAA
jgi:hypothetical protein